MRASVMFMLFIITAGGARTLMAADETIAIYVGPPTRDGFADVDRGVQDSINDIARLLRRTRRFRTVSTSGEARIVLTVLPRRSRLGENTGVVAVPLPGIGGVVGGGGPEKKDVLEAILSVGTYEKRLTHEGNSWFGLAQRIVNDLRAWVDANRAALPPGRP